MSTFAERVVPLRHPEWWLYAVAAPHPEVTFDPLRFFKDTEEAREYQAHVRGAKTPGR